MQSQKSGSLRIKCLVELFRSFSKCSASNILDEIRYMHALLNLPSHAAFSYLQTSEDTMSRQVTIEVEAVAPAGYTLRIEQGRRMEPADLIGILSTF